MTDAALVLVPNPVSFIVQKLLVYFVRKPEKRPGDLLYIHDTIVVFSPVLDDLAALWRSSVAPALSSKGHRELTDNVSATFGAVTDTLRNAARMVPTRRMDPEIMRRVCGEGLKRLLP